MKTPVISKIIAAGLLGFLRGILVHNYRVFYARTSLSAPAPPPLALDILQCIFLAGLVFAVYELVVFFVWRILKKLLREQN
jgi:hypothetical protein